ncbi:hypothetical protein PIB30_023537 [Stylosanthes scabra]|uniref:Uncharacterized protein n=1 Tax=Stylosanthes scabra TaxID=79078 RepID=A0ABU6VAC4_9FABA|nr:hypothetical protein [Stylosanthes scabra]
MPQPQRRGTLRARPRAAGSSGCSSGAGDAGGVGTEAGAINRTSQDPPGTCVDGGVQARAMNAYDGPDTSSFREPIQPCMRRGGKSRWDLSPLGLRGGEEVSLCARPRMMCMTSAGTTLILLCRCHVTPFPAASTASPPSPTSTALGHEPNELSRLHGQRIVSHHLIQPLPVPSRGPRANHHPSRRSYVIRHIWHDKSLWMWSDYLCVASTGISSAGS